MAEEDAVTRKCGTMLVHERLLRTVPQYAFARDNIENHALRAMYSPMSLRTGCTKIPVVVHVVYKTNAQNISNAQINSQIDVLNEDFRARNADLSTVPSVFQPFIGDARVEFELAKTDPDGNPTDGIVRVNTNNTSFSSDDDIKSGSTGGSDPWPANEYLNVWVGPRITSPVGDLLGYAQFPGGPAATDGVVVLHTAFGTSGTAAAPFDAGRTTTHEIGHWLNLQHIWGNDGTGCSGSDFVADTPNQGGPNYGTPTFPTVSCSNGPNGDMFMNYMDYVDDAAMVMFTAGQVTRMQAALDSSRSTIGSAISCVDVTPPQPCIIDPCIVHPCLPPPPCRPCLPPPCIVDPCIVNPCLPPPPCKPCEPCLPPPPCTPCEPCIVDPCLPPPPPPCKPCQPCLPPPPPCTPCEPCIVDPCLPPPPCKPCEPCLPPPPPCIVDPCIVDPCIPPPPCEPCEPCLPPPPCTPCGPCIIGPSTLEQPGYERYRYPRRDYRRYGWAGPSSYQYQRDPRGGSGWSAYGHWRGPRRYY